MKPIAVIDNTVLANFLDAGQEELLQKAQIVFNHFLIPTKVKDEFLSVEPTFLSKRQVFARNITSDATGFYRLCTTFDPIILGIAESLVSSGVDSGEAEAIAQAHKQGAKYFFTDDQDCATVVKKEFGWLIPMKTFSLIAILDIHGLLPNAPEVWRFFYQKAGFNHAQLKEAVIDAYSILGVRPDKNTLSVKTSWKRIFGNPPKKKRLV
ncbi:MAG: hypothetical protein MUC59_04345 [Saprospiraceae bacterium]|nr:hypothetical protein [Saprospiraceae bacterium]